MTETAIDIIVRESRAARRLGRLFKIERAGGFDRRPAVTVRRLVERRRGLVEELLALDGMRRSLASSHSAELDQALAGLAREVNRARDLAQIQVDRIGGDLRFRRGAGLPTGVRNGADGRLLGKV